MAPVPAGRARAEQHGGRRRRNRHQPRRGDRERIAGRVANRSSSKRNLADTYVWTAYGGLFSETTSTTDQVTWVTAGEYAVSGSTTIGGNIEFKAGSAAIEFSADVDFGGSSTITRTKTRDASRSFSLGAVCEPSRNLLDANNQPVPGRVDAYRFMSFYLDTSIDNYDDFYGKVIDPVWLATSSDPGAMTLRQSRQPGRKPPCWRIFHRVTFVSRVLPTPPSNAPQTLQATMSKLNMASNNAMVLQIALYLGVPATFDALTAAATTAISTPVTPPRSPPTPPTSSTSSPPTTTSPDGPATIGG